MAKKKASNGAERWEVCTTVTDASGGPGFHMQEYPSNGIGWEPWQSSVTADEKGRTMVLVVWKRRTSDSVPKPR